MRRSKEEFERRLVRIDVNLRIGTFAVITVTEVFPRFFVLSTAIPSPENSENFVSEAVGSDMWEDILHFLWTVTSVLCAVKISASHDRAKINFGSLFAHVN